MLPYAKIQPIFYSLGVLPLWRTVSRMQSFARTVELYKENIFCGLGAISSFDIFFRVLPASSFIWAAPTLPSPMLGGVSQLHPDLERNYMNTCMLRWGQIRPGTFPTPLSWEG